MYAEDWEMHTEDMLKQRVRLPAQSFFPVIDSPVQFQAVRAAGHLNPSGAVNKRYLTATVFTHAGRGLLF